MAGTHRAPKKQAIEGSRGTTFFVDPSVPQIIGFDTEYQKGEHVLWQKRALEPVDMALVNAMVASGQPLGIIDVRKNGPLIEVVAGRRRTKATRKANEIRAERGLPLIQMECKVIRGTDSELFGRVISENMLRKDVEPLDLAEDLQSYMNLGRNEKEAATVCGKTVAQVKHLLKLLDLDATVQDAIREGRISWTGGADLAELTREDQRVKLEELLSKGATTVAEVKREVSAHKRGEEAIPVPGKRLITKLLANEKTVEILGEEGITAIRFVLGDLPANRIKGLTDLIREVLDK